MLRLLKILLFLPLAFSVPLEECDGEDANFLQHRKGGGSSNISVAKAQNRRHRRGHCLGPIRPTLISANDGPEPYLLYQAGSNNVAGTRILTAVYKRQLKISSVRPDEAGLAFDIRCMFPVTSLDDLPDPNDDSNWNWTASDQFFKAIVDGGFAPLLKLGVNTWTSTRISGQSWVNWTTGEVTYVIPPKPYDICHPWPAIAPVINAIGPQLVMKIVERYNVNGALEASNWPRGFAGVELMNEWDTLICMPSEFGGCSSSGNKPTAAEWADWCYGPPFTWGSRYWDGTPQMAYDFYSATAKQIKQTYPGIRVGGPASGASDSFFPCGDISQTSLGMTWVKDFLQVVKTQNAPLDFFSFHYYGQGQGQADDMTSLPDMYNAYLQAISSVGGFGNLPIAITEYNAPFALGNTSAYVGSLAGAADNAAKMAFWVTQPRMHAAFLYQGLSGAFEALNPYSFPLGCSAQVIEPASNCSACAVTLVQQEETMKESAPPLPLLLAESVPHCGCTPNDILWDNNGIYGPTGEWDSSCSCPLGTLQGCTACDNYECQFGPVPESGMGAVYADGLLTPMGVLLSLLRPAQGSRRVKLSAAALEAKGVYPMAWQSRKRVAEVILSNPSTNVIHGLPSVREFMPSAIRVLDAIRLGQRSKTSNDVSAMDGFVSTVPLLGTIFPAPRFKGPATKKLGPLQAYQVVKLWVLFEGCSSGYYAAQPTPSRQ